MTRFSVVIIEDETETRAKLKCLIEQRNELEFLGAAGSLKDGRALLVLAPNIVLLDLGLPDGNGIELIHEIKQQSEATEIMVISAFGDEWHVIQAIESGATGYVLKSDPLDMIGSQILGMMNGESPISPAIARHILRKCQPESHGKQEQYDESGLTQREKEVLTLIAKGYTRSEAGGLLDLSHHTVTTHIKNIYKKLGVHTRTEAVYEACQMGLMQLND